MKLKDKLDASLGETYLDEIISKERIEKKQKGKKPIAQKSKGISRNSDERRQKLNKLKKFNRAKQGKNTNQQGNKPAQQPGQGKKKRPQGQKQNKGQVGGKPVQAPRKATAPKKFKQNNAQRGRRQRGGRRFGRN